MQHNVFQDKSRWYVVIIQSCVQVLRVIDSLQLTSKYSVATPVDWQNGDKVMVTPNLSDEQAKEKVSLYSAVSYVLAVLFVACNGQS